MNHLAETAKHYANLAEQYRSQLVEEQQLNEDLLVVIDALCEELNLDTEQILQEAGIVKSLGNLVVDSGKKIARRIGFSKSTTGETSKEKAAREEKVKQERAREEEVKQERARREQGAEERRAYADAEQKKRKERFAGEFSRPIPPPMSDYERRQAREDAIDDEVLRQKHRQRGF
jgi:uncharacterized protein (DUF3084 family)